MSVDLLQSHTDQSQMSSIGSHTPLRLGVVVQALVQAPAIVVV
jgi:hypothetical protein